MMKKRYQVKLVRTQGEWDSIDKLLSDAGDNGWCEFLKKNISLLRDQYRKCPTCITPANGDKKKRCIDLNEGQYKLLEAIAFQMKKPVASVIDELIISPILHSPQ